ncbi:MAG: hypothetical protein IKT70_04465 [Clostridia bacterium]|nr:hypothetical protein [Clostridia bacterium]
MKKNAIIFGDSYSTFDGFIPEGYEVFYTPFEYYDTDVRNVSETWWHQVVTEADLNLVLNDSWSGSTICYTGYDNVDCSESSSFICRLKKLIAKGFFEENKIDTVFVFGGTNDSWSDDPLGEMKFDDFDKSELYSVLPGICYFLKLLRETLPDADIYCLINTEIKQEIASCLEKVSEKYGMTPVTFDTIDKTGDHPTIKGMKEIKDTVLKAMNR